MGTVRADDMESARRDDALPTVAVQAGLAIQLLESRVCLLSARSRADQRRPVGRVRAEKHLRATRHESQLLPKHSVFSRDAAIAQLLRSTRFHVADLTATDRQRIRLRSGDHIAEWRVERTGE